MNQCFLVLVLTMITLADTSSFDTSYFEIVEVKDYTLTLCSKNTGHYWALLERIANGYRTFLISHRHYEKDPYHFQKNRGSADGGIHAVIEYIMHHDEDYISRLREKELRRKLGGWRGWNSKEETNTCKRLTDKH